MVDQKAAAEAGDDASGGVSKIDVCTVVQSLMEKEVEKVRAHILSYA